MLTFQSRRTLVARQRRTAALALAIWIMLKTYWEHLPDPRGLTWLHLKCTHMTCSLGLQPIRSQNTKTRPKTNTQFANLEGSTHEKIFFSPAGRLISICQMKNLSPAPGQNDNDIAARLANGFLSLSLFLCVLVSACVGVWVWVQLCDCFLTMTPKCLALCGLVAALSLTSTVSVDKLEQKVKISHPADKCGSRDFSWSVRDLNMKPGEAVNWETSQTHTQRRWVECFFPMRGWQISINHINPHLTLPIPPPTSAFHSHCLPKSFHFAHLA